MSDNVILLGAGASADAGIPMIGQFMDTMWTVAKLGRCNGNPLEKADLDVLHEGLKVRTELDGYHGRAALDVWNIEDILSVLSFTGTKRLEWMTKAMARVIELTCNVTHSGNLNQRTDDGTIYMAFWRALIDWAQEHNAPIPPILTLNYDLVLERSLLSSLVGTYYRNSRPFEHKGVNISYSTNACEDIQLKAETGSWPVADYTRQPGMILSDLAHDEISDLSNYRKFQLLKLHGSVNFPRPRRSVANTNGSQRLITALEDPLILPPVFNKATDTVGKDVWTQALMVLRECKNLIVCGYSLPKTDIYMQYFLKAALGPNQDLNHIYVFDPDLFRARRRSQGEALQGRYAENFSEPIQRRIDFRPWCPEDWPEDDKGTMAHLTWLLQKHPGTLLFG